MKAISLLMVILAASCSSARVSTSQGYSKAACDGLMQKYELAIVSADKQYDAAVANFESSRPDPGFIDIADAAAMAGNARAEYDNFKASEICTQ